MNRHAQTLLPLLIACGALCLLWYKRVMITLSFDERMIFIPFCGVGFLVMALLLDSGILKRDNRSIIVFCCAGSILFTALALAPGLLHYLGLVVAGMFTGGNFLVVIIAGLRLLPLRYRGRAFAFSFLVAGLINTATDISELPFLFVQGQVANLIMACLSLSLCLALMLIKGRAFNFRNIPIASGAPTETSRMVRIGALAVTCFFLLYISLSLKESVAYPAAITQVSPNGWIRFIEIPLWLIAGFVTDLLGRRVLIIASLVTAFIGAAGILATDSSSVTALTSLCVYFCEVGFPTACCALLVDVSFYTRSPSIMGFLSFAPLVVGQLLEGVALPFLQGLTNDTIFIIDIGILALLSVLSIWLFSLVSSSLTFFQATVEVIEFEGEARGLATPEQIAKDFDLTRREQEILALIISGKTVRQMASELYVSESTVKFHITNMLKKTASINRQAMLEKFGTPQNR
jgi:DNA-binding CsgD family transcriptional regulator